VPRYFLKLSYNGTAYHGWQVQVNTPATVQEVLNEMLSRLLNQPVFITGCGRTDTGVHAREFYGHFDATVDLLKERDKWIFRFNQALPGDIAIYNIFVVKEDANSRFDAISRTYEYHITKKKDPFLIDQAWVLHGNLDVQAMNKAALTLFDYTDFSSFAKSNTQAFTNNCKIYKAIWIEENDRLVFTISADRFLRNMVRAVVGTLIEVGKGKMNIEEFKNVIESRNRSKAGFSVPAGGLYLTKVEYPLGDFDVSKDQDE
jgi:tRNA pseudouridine38-40 synthase